MFLCLCDAQCSTTRVVEHYLLHSWPDHGIPDVGAVLACLRDMRARRPELVRAAAAAARAAATTSPNPAAATTQAQASGGSGGCASDSNSNSNAATATSERSEKSDSSASAGSDASSNLNATLVQAPAAAEASAVSTRLRAAGSSTSLDSTQSTASGSSSLADAFSSSSSSSVPPLVVHCSAGVGRTGTLVAIDFNVDRIEAQGILNVAHAVRLLRVQRARSVDTPSQYARPAVLAYDYAYSTRILVHITQI